jgi:hypothetical protein
MASLTGLVYTTSASSWTVDAINCVVQVAPRLLKIHVDCVVATLAILPLPPSCQVRRFHFVLPAQAAT